MIVSPFLGFWSAFLAEIFLPFQSAFALASERSDCFFLLSDRLFLISLRYSYRQIGGTTLEFLWRLLFSGLLER